VSERLYSEINIKVCELSWNPNEDLSV